MQTRPITSIKAGKRHRRDLGDLAGLADSFNSLGLLHPVVVTPSGRLIAGERRLEACKSLGWKKVPVRVVDLDKVVRGGRKCFSKRLFTVRDRFHPPRPGGD
jgi:ParB family transcriptional regulator, chromosome partitioning protein